VYRFQYDDPYCVRDKLAQCVCGQKVPSVDPRKMGRCAECTVFAQCAGFAKLRQIRGGRSDIIDKKCNLVLQMEGTSYCFGKMSGKIIFYANSSVVAI
jgi:hypothetical protein